MAYIVAIRPLPQDNRGNYGEVKEIEIEAREQLRASVPEGWQAISIRAS